MYTHTHKYYTNTRCVQYICRRQSARSLADWRERSCSKRCHRATIVASTMRRDKRIIKSENRFLYELIKKLCQTSAAAEQCLIARILGSRGGYSLVLRVHTYTCVYTT